MAENCANLCLESLGVDPITGALVEWYCTARVVRMTTMSVPCGTEVEMPPTLEEFKEACRRECSFLVSEYDFQEMPDPREYNVFSVCFRRGSLGVDVYGEGWGQHASC